MIINVTKPFFPPKEEYYKYLDSVWSNGWLTNNGPLVNQLELELKNYLKVENLLFLSNGTLALQLAIKALDLRGSIITTPFTYVATTSSIVWEGLHPIFVDIDESSLNIDEKKIEAKLRDDTSAILATHVYGNPCEIDLIQQIADRNDLKVIYDAAHCFGTLYKGISVFNYGDISTASFHATKLFHTVEGGASFTGQKELHKRLGYMRNFGHDGFDRFNGVGINAKNSELHAAMGLLNLKYIDAILKRRKEIYNCYLDHMNDQPLKFLAPNIQSTYNHSYFPVIFPSETFLLKAISNLNSKNIFPRRYFYPSLNKLEYVSSVSDLPIAEDVSRRILCLPVFHDLDDGSIVRIANIIGDSLSAHR